MTMSDTLETIISSKEQLTDDIFGFRFKPVSGVLPPAEPGAHIDIYLPSGAVRQYSLTRLADESDAAYEIAVLREEQGRGGSLELCDQLSAGDRIKISSPRNNFRLEPEQKRYCLLAAGIGLTPLLSMARSLKAKGADFMLHICTKTLQHVPFKEQLEAEGLAQSVSYHLSGEGDRLSLPQFLQGVEKDAQVYACGPVSFLDEITELTRDWPAGRVRQERFVADIAALDNADKGAFTVRLAKSGGEFLIPEDQSILQVLEANNVLRESACLEGVCGTCLTPVIAGDIIHRDACLYDEEKAENKSIACCVSRGKPGSVVVLDL